MNQQNPTVPDPVAAAWREAAAPLAETFMGWANRVDVYGQYYSLNRRETEQRPDGTTRVRKARTRPPKDMRGIDKLSLYELRRHAAGRDVGHIIGLHSTAPGNTCKWGAWDIDAHEGEKADPAANLKTALLLFDTLTSLGFSSLLTDSNGRGGYHVLLVFAEPVPAAKMYAFLQHLKQLVPGLEKHETFPKQDGLDTGKGCGNWLRLPGRHHTYDHWSKVWNPETRTWMEGREAVAAILALPANPVHLIPDVKLPEPPPAPTPRPPQREGAGRMTDAEIVRQCLDRISPDLPYDQWLRVGMAAHHVDPSAAMCAEFSRWSQGSSKYKAGEPEEKWKSFSTGGARMTRLGTLVKLARERDPGFLTKGSRARTTTTRTATAPKTPPMTTAIPAAEPVVTVTETAASTDAQHGPRLIVESHGSPNGKALANIAIRDAEGVLLYEDRVDLVSASGRGKFSKAAADHMGRDPAAVDKLLLGELERIRRDAATPKPDEKDKAGMPDVAALLAETPPEIVAEAEVTLRDPELLRRISDDIEAMGIAGERKLSMLVYATAVSRMLPKPNNAIIQGPSSSGKSIIAETVAELMPDEFKIIATQMTPQAFFHMEHGSLRHRVIFGGERSRKENDESADTTRAFREMASAGRLTKLMPEKVDGRIETRLIDQPGPIAFIETTTLTNIFEEDLNRCILANTDETQEQTRRILASIAANRAKRAEFRSRRERIKAMHHAMQHLLARTIPATVEIPYAERLAELFPIDRTGTRRAFGHLLNFIEACALLHQYQRPVSDGGAIIATTHDYAVARYLLLDPIARAIGGGLSDAAKRFRDRLYKWAHGTFTTTEAVKHEKRTLSDHTVRDFLKELSHAGWLDCVEDARGARPAKWRLPENEPDEADALGLPTVDEVCDGKPELSEIHATSDPSVVNAIV